MIRKGLGSILQGISCSRCEDDPGNLIERVVTQDKTWARHFNPESEMRSKQWKHTGLPPPKDFKRVHSVGKLVASIFLDSQGVIMIDYLEQSRKINGAYYAGESR